MAKVEIELNYKGVGELLKSEEMKNYLAGCASDILARCGDGYETDTYNAGTRVIASVSTASAEAMRDNSKNNTLLKALGGQG